MKLLKEITIIFGISLIGIFLNQFIGLSASILALFVLAILLFLKLIKQEKIENITKFFLHYMPLFFIPATVKIMDEYQLILPYFFGYIVVCIISTILTFFVSGKVVSILIRRINK